MPGGVEVYEEQGRSAMRRPAGRCPAAATRNLPSKGHHGILLVASLALPPASGRVVARRRRHDLRHETLAVAM